MDTQKIIHIYSRHTYRQDKNELENMQNGVRSKTFVVVVVVLIALVVGL